jgi:hypothetical protein
LGHDRSLGNADFARAFGRVSNEEVFHSLGGDLGRFFNRFLASIKRRKVGCKNASSNIVRNDLGQLVFSLAIKLGASEIMGRLGVELFAKASRIDDWHLLVRHVNDKVD